MSLLLVSNVVYIVLADYTARDYVDDQDVDGHDTAQAVIRRLPTAAAQVQSQMKSFGICGARSDWERFSSSILGSPSVLIP
jgi:hypothetical protein